MLGSDEQVCYGTSTNLKTISGPGRPEEGTGVLDLKYEASISRWYWSNLKYLHAILYFRRACSSVKN